jgi:hypothetical protein
MTFMAWFVELLVLRAAATMRRADVARETADAASAKAARAAEAAQQKVHPSRHPGQHGQPWTVATALSLGDQGVAPRSRPAAPRARDRSTRPQEVPDLVLVLASDRAGNVTGADFVIDGGLMTTL